MSCGPACNFQYPQSDRRRCNCAESWDCSNIVTFSILNRIGGDATRHPAQRGIRADFLSVSSIGSEAMQRSPGSPPRGSCRRLSVSSIGSEAMQQTSFPSLLHSRYFLSVSSIGSEAMQPGSAWASAWWTKSFQYPQSDRRRCNDGDLLLAAIRWITFSILNRIGGDATIEIDHLVRRDGRFQYPQSDRRRCNRRGGRSGR